MRQLFFHVFFMSMIPVVELRGAIPYGLAAGLDPWLTYLAAAAGNMVPVPFIMIIIRRIFNWAREHSRWLGNRVRWLEARAEKKSDLVQRNALAGLTILVAIPLPGTGAWTGTLAASFLNMGIKSTSIAVSLGVVIAGFFMGAVAMTGVHVFGL